MKFYSFLVLFYGLGFLLQWAYTRLSMDSYNIEMPDDLLALEIKNGNIDVYAYKQHAETASLYIFAAVCFAAFFAIPPKPLRQVSAATIFIALIGNPLFYDSFTGWLSDFSFIAICISTVWLCSYGWHCLTLHKRKNL